MITLRVLKTILWLALLFISYAVHSSAFHHLNKQDGLSQSIVFDIEQDRFGYIWFATQDGLNRYDGEHITVYKPKQDNALGMTDGYIYPLATADKHNLLLGTKRGGVNRFSLETKHFRAPILPNHRITAITVKDNYAYFGTYRGEVYRLDLINHELTLFYELTKQPIYALYVSTKTLWVGSHGDGLHLVEISSGQRTDIRIKDSSLSKLLHKSIFAIRKAEKGIWLASQGGGLYFYELQQSALRQWTKANSDLTSNDLRDIAIDRQGSVWIASRGGGAYRFFPKSERWQHFSHDPFDPYSITHNRVYSVLIDQTGYIWFGTANGVSKLNPNTLNFNKLNRGNGLSNNDAWALLEGTQQQLWYGSWGAGVDLLQVKGSSLSPSVARELSGRLSSQVIKTLVKDAQDHLWVGHWQSGVDIVSPDGSIVQLHTENSGLPSNQIYTMLADQQGIIWLGTRDKGLVMIDSKSKKVSRDKLPAVLQTGHITAIAQSNDKSIWVARDGEGLFKLDPHTLDVKRYKKEASTLSLAHNSVRGVFESSDSRLWITTAQGLSILDLTSDKFIANEAVAKFDSQNLYSLLSDNQGGLWLSSNNGLWHWDRERKLAKQYLAKDGLQGSEFNAGAALKMSDGSLVFGGTQGLTIFKPPFELPQKYQAQLRLAELKIDEQPLNAKKLASLNEAKRAVLEIPAKSLRVAARFDYLYFNSPNQHIFKYRLEGFETNWQTKNDNVLALEYTNLPPGEYQLEVEVAADEYTRVSRWHMPINVAAPWYQSWWSYLLFASLAVFILFVCHLLWTVRLRKQREVLSQQVVERTALITDQKSRIQAQASELENILEEKRNFIIRAAHELRTPLSLILAPCETLLANELDGFKRAQLALIHKNSLRLKGMAERLLLLSKYDRDIDLSQDCDLTAVTNNVCKSFVVYTTPTLDFTYDIDESVAVLGAQDAVIDLLNNLLDNAFKYTQRGLISLSLRQRGEWAELVVVDTGQGIEQAQLQTIFELFYREQPAQQQLGYGVGLNIVKSIVDKLNGEIVVQSEVGVGTRFCVTLPLASEPVTHVSSTEDALFTDTQPAKNTTPIQQGAILILIAEDNADLRLYLQQELEHIASIITAEDGEQALLLAKFHRPTLILSDVMMPKLGGVELLQALKESPETASIPTLLLTAKQDDKTRLEALAANCLGVLYKPFTRDELLMSVQNILHYLEQHSAIKPHNGSTDMELQDLLLLQQLDEFLEQHYFDSKLTIGEIAKGLAMSERQLQRKLKQLLTKTPNEYLRDYRLEQAAELLRRGIQVNLVAEQTGFSSRSSFSRAFKGHFGLAPRDYK